MADCYRWLSRPWTGRRETQHAYIYLYSPEMRKSSSPQCLVCILFGLCLAFIVILASTIIYHLNRSDHKTSGIGAASLCCATNKRHSPDFVNSNIDPCENFYKFVCDKWMRAKDCDLKLDDRMKRIQIQQGLHQQLMNNHTKAQLFIENQGIHRFYQLCENQPPALLLDEVERYFSNLSHQEPYRSYLTLFNRTIPISTNASLFGTLNMFFRVEPILGNTWKVIRTFRYRPVPPAVSIFPNLTVLNQTALKNLIRFDDYYRKLFVQEEFLLESGMKKYSINRVFLQRIDSYSNYVHCLSSLSMPFTSSNGRQILIEILNQYLRLRLSHLKTELISKQIRMLEKIIDPSTLIEQLRNIRIELKAIDQLVLSSNDTQTSNTSCIFTLLDQLLDERIGFNELPATFRIFLNGNHQDYFVSNDWPFLMMIYDRLLTNVSADLLVNFAFFHSYRQLIYPYYQPHIQHENQIILLHSKESSGFTYSGTYPNSSCNVHSCLDILNCYHRSLLNRFSTIDNQTFIKDIESSVESLIDRFRSLTEQSDHLNANGKKYLLNQLNNIEIHLGDYSKAVESQLDFHADWSYFDYVQHLSSFSYDRSEPSYFFEPIYFPLNNSLYLPYGFLSLNNKTFEYHLVKLFLKIFRHILSSNPFNIECFFQSNDNSRSEYLNRNQSNFNDEHFAYIFLRSKYMSQENILPDEYWWPFVKDNSLMKHFLITYTKENYCQVSSGESYFNNNTYLTDDVYLVFYCQKATLIKQFKCTIN